MILSRVLKTYEATVAAIPENIYKLLLWLSGGATRGTEVCIFRAKTARLLPAIFHRPLKPAGLSGRRAVRRPFSPPLSHSPLALKVLGGNCKM